MCLEPGDRAGTKQEEVEMRLVIQPSLDTAEERGHAAKKSKPKMIVTQKMLPAGTDGLHKGKADDGVYHR